MKKEKIKIPCPDCGQLFSRNGLQMHNLKAHVIEKLASAENRIKELEAAALADANGVSGELTEDQRVAVLGDWLGTITKEAWVKIGETAGYFDLPAETQPATPVAQVSDSKVDAPVGLQPQVSLADNQKPKERLVYLATSGAMLRVMEAK
jgi:hypothetical protein